MSGVLGVRLVGDGLGVPCVDGIERSYLSLDAAASTNALPAVASRVQEFLPWYSSVHRGAGWKSQLATAEYEAARAAFAAFAGRTGTDDVAIICRNTTEAINHLAYRLQLRPDDVVVTTVVEHHANLLPWARVARRRTTTTNAATTWCGSERTTWCSSAAAPGSPTRSWSPEAGHRRLRRNTSPATRRPTAPTTFVCA